MASITAWRTGVSAALKQVWAVAQPVLFASVGAAADLSAVEGRFVGLAVLVVLLALAARCCITFGVLSCEAFLNWRERLFVTLAWLPKATVQAAIGSLALDAARSQDAGDTEVRAGQILLTTAVMSILLTAPLGALAIAMSGPKLLSTDSGDAAAADSVLVSQATAGNAGAATASAGHSGSSDTAVAVGDVELVERDDLGEGEV